MAKILIIGAGVAGLSAALELRSKGHTVSIVEAKNEIGGRAFSEKIEKIYFDWGAEAIEAKSDAAAWVLNDDAYNTVNPPANYVPAQNPLPVAIPNADGKLYQLPFLQNGARQLLNTGAAVTPAHSTTVQDNIDAVSGNFDVVNDDYFDNVNIQLGTETLGAVQFRQAQLETWQVQSDAVEVNPPWGSVHNFVWANDYNDNRGNDKAYVINQVLGKRVQKWAIANNLDGLGGLVTKSTAVQRAWNTGGNTVTVRTAGHDDQVFDAVLVTVPTDKVKAPSDAQIAPDDLYLPDLSAYDIAPFRSNPLGCYFKLLITGLDGVQVPSPGKQVMVTFESGYSQFTIFQNASASQIFLHAPGDTGRVMSDNHPLAAEVLVQAIKRLNNPYVIPDNVTAYIFDWCKEPYYGGAYSTTRPGEWASRAALAAFKNGRIYYAGEAASQRWYGQVAGAMESGNATALRMHADLA